MISEQDKKYLLSLTPDDITYDLLVDLYSDRVEKNKDGKMVVKPARFNTYDEFILNPGEYFNTEKITTNVGLFIFNKFIIEEDFSKVVGYVNFPVDSGAVRKIESKMSDALLNDEIKVEQMVKYLNKFQWLSMYVHHILAGSFTMKGLKPIPEVVKRRDQLLKEHADEIADGKVEVMARIEKELVEQAKAILKDDPSTDLYNSGARGSFGNNYKAISIMKGPVYDPISGKYKLIEANYMEGLKKTDIPQSASSVVAGAYPKAVGTATGGYQAKSLSAALQAVELDKAGSDCGSKGYIEVTMKASQTKDFLYRYIIENGKYVLLEPETIGKYVGKKVKMRSPMYCVGKKLCRRCAGLMYEKLGITSVGMTASRAASTLMNLSMKKFHDSSVKMEPIDIVNITAN